MENKETELTFAEQVEQMKGLAEALIKKNGIDGSIKEERRLIKKLSKNKEIVLGPYRHMTIEQLEQKDAEEIKQALLDWVKDLNRQMSWRCAVVRAIEKLS